jgi:hypothetical protein
MTISHLTARKTAAARARLYRQRKRDGLRRVRLWLPELGIEGLEERGFLAPGARAEDEIEEAVCRMLQAAWDAGVTRDGRCA